MLKISLKELREKRTKKKMKGLRRTSKRKSLRNQLVQEKMRKED